MNLGSMFLSPLIRYVEEFGAVIPNLSLFYNVMVIFVFGGVMTRASNKGWFWPNAEKHSKRRHGNTWDHDINTPIYPIVICWYYLLGLICSFTLV